MLDMCLRWSLKHENFLQVWSHNMDLPSALKTCGLSSISLPLGEISLKHKKIKGFVNSDAFSELSELKCS